MAGKRTVKLSQDADLVAEAKAAGADLSAVLEQALRRINRDHGGSTSEQRAACWREENRDAIAASNTELEANGMWYRPEWLEANCETIAAWNQLVGTDGHWIEKYRT